jgi:hypothetical protein
VFRSRTNPTNIEYTYIFGAACPAKDKALGLVLPLANTDGMIELIKLGVLSVFLWMQDLNGMVF